MKKTYLIIRHLIRKIPVMLEYKFSFLKSSTLLFYLIENSKIFSTSLRRVNEINIWESSSLGQQGEGNFIAKEIFSPSKFQDAQVQRDYEKIRRGGLLFVWKVRAVLLDIDDAL